MKVWVVVSDYGLNGCQVHGVYSAEPDRKDVDRFVMASGPGRKFALTSVTGYGGTSIEEFEVDGELT